ncbi:dihydrolipoamide acetyltransferase family protein [Dasania marina]|uniref:dihydrolipoamide acetyltransferase family protein n=1 Tax=Dasania marina TaxID=471499 RepID=UPI0030D71A69|tara:strand:- start:8309 stop:9664 length:1356 start_codon:yes stop_codon:yes gene_type:complete
MSEFSFKLPDLGEGIVESEIVAWHIAVGDEVAQDQHIADVQTDKAVIEATSPISGRVLKLGCSAGEVLAVGRELILFETDTTIQSKAASSQPAAEIPSETINKTAATPPAASNNDAQKNTRSTSASDNTETADSGVLTSPSVRLRARQHNVDLRKISGSGPKGRINHSDLDNLIPSTPSEDKSGNNTGSNSSNTSNNSKQKSATNADNPSDNNKKNTGDKRYTLSGTRRIIAKKLQQAAQQIPHYSYVEEVDVTALEQLREQLNQQRSSEQNKLTLLPFIIQALVQALPYFPHCNAHFNNDNNEVTEYKAVHVGIATMTDKGLVVPVLRDCEHSELWQCAAAIEQLASAARHHRLSPQQLSGSTITLTSLGKLGGIAATPIINAPETCIIGINKIQRRPVVIDEAIAIRSIMNVSASFDHRVVDGFDGASLIQAIKKLLEQPQLLSNNEPT